MSVSQLTEIAVRYFRSLYDVSLPLKPLNVVIGPNGSGKSNLVRLLRFVRDIATDPHASRQYQSAVRDLVWYGREDGEKVYNFDVTLTLRTEPTQPDSPQAQGEALAHPPKVYQYTVDVNTLKGELTFPREILRVVSEEGDALSRTRTRAEIREDANGPAIFTVDPKILSLQYLSPLTSSQVVQGTQHFIAGWRFLEVDTGLARKSTAPVSVRPERIPELRPDAGNLSEFLHALRALQPDDFAEISERMRNAIEFLEEIRVEERPLSINAGVEAGYQLKERAFPDVIPPDSTSDGTIRLLAILALLIGDPSPSLVCLEEPDHNLHPHMMQHLADAMRYVASERRHPQIVVTTHSPDFLNGFNPDAEADYLNVFVAHKDPQTGKTGFRLVDLTQLAHWLEAYRMGELFQIGLLDSYARGER